MAAFLKGWCLRRDRDPELERRRRLRRQFARVSRRSGLIGHRRLYRRGIVAALTVAAGLYFLTTASPWPLGVTLRHLAAAPNCAAARVVGLAPARRGEAGYWPKHDRDDDGIACEAWPHR